MSAETSRRDGPARLTLGVEEEFLLVDADGRLSRQGPVVAERTDSPDGELQQELTRCQVESATGVCLTVDEVAGQLGELRGRLARTAAGRQLRLLPVGCPVFAENRSPEITPNPRYQRAAAEFGATARVAATCGCHVHVAIPDKETGVRLSDHLRPWLPLLLTVTANSVFADGSDSGYCSWRYPLWSRWPSAGPPPVFGSVDHYESAVDTMLRSGAIIDRGMVYWDIRLSDDQPTLEFRIGDVAAQVDEAALLAVVVRGLVRTALEEISDGHPAPALSSEALRANLWRAARDGFTGRILHPKTGCLTPVADQWAETVELIKPALKEYGDDEFVERGFARLRENGGGARRQRAAFDRRRNLHDVVGLLAVDPAQE
ncbi:carboxylate-amine ligase [Amycolatopsis sp. NBC_01480]|uniref:carboxylate-amine ligase n=1 Tax=Amycolatopsis sp. NBC_01480 TaxID=2903562 RepID=UPI002E283796|nr:glutamate--cysteine ligase [Amycolatopsis sp. NBC_01480]